jgi:CRISPR-associated endonuclease Cas3-HD
LSGEHLQEDPCGQSRKCPTRFIPFVKKHLQLQFGDALWPQEITDFLPVTKEKAMLIKLWAKKLSNQGMADPSFHPLLCHMLDVAAVTECLWQSALERGFRKEISARLNLKEEQTGNWLAFWAGLHDLGKASPAFQGKWQEGWESLGPELRLRKLPNNPLPHGILSAAFIPELLTRRFPIFPRNLADRLGRALGGHHGTFPRSGDLKGINKDQCGGGNWKEVRRELFYQFAGQFTLEADILSGDPGLMGNLSKSCSQIGIEHLENKDRRKL